MNTPNVMLESGTTGEGNYNSLTSNQSKNIKFTEHGLKRAKQRGFTESDILEIIKNGDISTQPGQFNKNVVNTLYMYNGNTVILNEHSELITVFSNAPAKNGLIKGFIIK